MQDLWKQFRTGSAVLSICMLILGFIMVIWPGISALVICYIFGAICLLGGIYSLIRHFRLGEAGLFFGFDLSFGICCCLVGILLMLHPLALATLLPVAAGLYMIVSGIAGLQTSLQMRSYGYSSWIISCVLSVVTIVAAVLLFLHPFKGTEAIMMLIGTALIISGVSRIYSILVINRAVRNVDDANGAIDVDWTWKE